VRGCNGASFSVFLRYFGDGVAPFRAFGISEKAEHGMLLAWTLLWQPTHRLEPGALSTLETAMLDVLFLVILLFSCVSALAYVSACERL
jgi:hypothetical protein